MSGWFSLELLAKASPHPLNVTKIYMCLGVLTQNVNLYRVGEFGKKKKKMLKRSVQFVRYIIMTMLFENNCTYLVISISN